MKKIHEMIQSYLDRTYLNFSSDIQQTLHFRGNEIYGEILYYSAIKLFKFLKLGPHDHFLDVGSGLGKLLFYVYFATEVKSITGIEINSKRHAIAERINNTIQTELPLDKKLQLVEGDFLTNSFDDATVVYLCSTIFSYELLENLGIKLNKMLNVKKIATFRKLPFLNDFRLIKKLLIHCSWERVGCYIYERKN